MEYAGRQRRDRGRDDVLLAAQALIAQRGFDGVSMRDIAEELDFGVSALYRHVASKDDVLTALTSPLLDAVDGLLEEPPHTDMERHKWFSSYLHVLNSNRTTARIIASDAAVKAHKTVGVRLRAQDACVRQALMPHRHDDGDAERLTAAALGAVWWPLVCLDDTVELNENLVDVALQVVPLRSLHESPTDRRG